MPLMPGQFLQNRYQVQSLLGQGGMGSVYRAYDQTLNRFVAIKERTPDPTAAPQALATARAQFQREAQVLANLNHPNLPRVTDYFTYGNGEYLVMDFVEGTDLDALVRQRGAQSEATMLAWANQLLDALAYVHGRGVIHRDIKPHNIILAPDGRVTLVDFGLVKLIDLNNPYTATSMRGMGTAGYAPVEQYASGSSHTDARSDLYALGATMYFVLTAREPAEVHQRVMNPTALIPPRSINPGISAQTESVILRAMEVQPQNRFASAAEMRLVVNFRPVTPRTVPMMQPTAYTSPLPIGSVSQSGTWGVAKAIAIGSGILVPVLIVGMVWFLTMRQPPPTPAPTAQPPTAVLVLAPTALAPTSASTVPAPTPAPTVLAPTGIGGVPANRSNDNAEMVFVPAGEFTMGINSGYSDEQPAHTVYLDPYWLDKYEVTNALYKRCADTGKCSPPFSRDSSTRNFYYGNSSFNNYPVVNVSWNEANVYCTWVSKRLPTEAEWEKAARGTDGRIFPWGNTWDAAKANSTDSNPRLADTAAVGSYPSGTSAYSAMDMAGNIWEWVADWYDPNFYASSPRVNPQGSRSGHFRVLRGGSFGNLKDSLRAVARNSFGSDVHNTSIGFRCAMNP